MYRAISAVSSHTILRAAAIIGTKRISRVATALVADGEIGAILCASPVVVKALVQRWQ